MMKICIFQPPYPQNPTPAESDESLGWIYEKFNSLKPGEQDLIMLGEFANAPGMQEQLDRNAENFCDYLAQQARRLRCNVAAGVAIRDAKTLRNRALLYGRDGSLLAAYDKIHLTDIELSRYGFTPGSAPVVADIEGVRVGFAICFDIYFAEFIETLAQQKIDLLLCPSYQRSESDQRIKMISSCRAMDAGAYLIRSSYSMLPTHGFGGHSLVAAPDGTILADAGEGACVLHVNIDPGAKFSKPASHGQPPTEHRQLISQHRRPHIYSPHSARVQDISQRPFPLICAHRGLSIPCPENTLPSFGAAIAIGADEIELDIWSSADGVPVVCHDPDLSRTTNISGIINQLSWQQIQQADAGINRGIEWADVKIPRFEEVVDFVDGRAGINIHMKDAGKDGALVKMVCDILRDRGLLASCYIAGAEDVLEVAQDYAPDVALDSLAGQDIPDSMIDAALKYGCKRVQFYRNVEEKHTKRAHEAGIICNLFYSNNPMDAQEYLDIGIDCILTDCAHQVNRSTIGRGPGIGKWEWIDGNWKLENVD